MIQVSLLIILIIPYDQTKHFKILTIFNSERAIGMYSIYSFARRMLYSSIMVVINLGCLSTACFMAC